MGIARLRAAALCGVCRPPGTVSAAVPFAKCRRGLPARVGSPPEHSPVIDCILCKFLRQSAARFVNTSEKVQKLRGQAESRLTKYDHIVYNMCKFCKRQNFVRTKAGHRICTTER